MRNESPPEIYDSSLDCFDVTEYTDDEKGNYYSLGKVADRSEAFIQGFIDVSLIIKKEVK